RHGRRRWGKTWPDGRQGDRPPSTAERPDRRSVGQPARQPARQAARAAAHKPFRTIDVASTPAPLKKGAMTQRSHEDIEFARFRTSGNPESLAEVYDATAAELLRVASHLASDRAA